MSFDYKLTKLFEESVNGYRELSEEELRSKVESEASNFNAQQKIYHFIPKEKIPSSDILYLEYNPNEARDDEPMLYHELIMDNLKSWAEYPKRENAIVGYTDKKHTTISGVPFVVIPVNDTPLAICSKLHLIDSFSYVSINLGIKFEDFDRTINILLNIFNNPEGTYDPETKKLTLTDETAYNESYSTFYNAMKVVDKQFHESYDLLDEIENHPHNKETEDNVISVIEYLRAKKTNLSNTFKKLFDPTENAFKKIQFEEFVVGENKDRETWINSPCFLVKETELIKIVGD